MTIRGCPLLRVGVAGAALVLAGGCSVQQSEAKSPISAGSCPEKVVQLIDSAKTPAEELDVMVDKSKSYVGSDAAVARMERQVQAAVSKAVDTGAALRVSVFVGSVATVDDVVVCPTMAAKFNNDSAKPSRVAYLKKVAVDEVLAAVRDAKPSKGGKGTSVVGGWAAMAAATPLADQRHAVMLSDGRGGQEDVPVKLRGFATVGMYSVGRTADGTADTESTEKLVTRWKKWLTSHGAAPGGLTVTSGELQ